MLLRLPRITQGNGADGYWDKAGVRTISFLAWKIEAGSAARLYNALLCFFVVQPLTL